MRTTVRLDDELMRRLKSHAAQTGRTLTGLIEEALRQYLASTRKRPRRGTTSLTTVGGNGPQPGIDLDNTAELLDVMERSR